MGYDPKNDPEYQAGRNELGQHLTSGNPDWSVYNGDKKPDSRRGCLLIPFLLGAAGATAASLGLKYGVNS